MRLRILYAGLLVFSLSLGVASPLAAQEARGTILGTITDSQGAVVPGASIVITNIDTNTNSRTSSNATGYYEVPLLSAGNYQITAELTGFKKMVRGPVVLNVASRMEINFTLEVGSLTETVAVTAEAPLLETTSASGGRVIDRREIMELPFSDMNPFALTALASGMQWTGQPEYRRPFDNGGTSAFNTSGNAGQNEYTIDGAPVTGTQRRVGFTPPSDAVEEFKMETSNFDASSGHTAGASVNVMTKSGTNAYHGSLYDQHWQQRWNATQHFTRLKWEAIKASGKDPGEKQGPGRSNQFGATLGGPIRVPKIYNGRDKAFFFFSYNGIYQNKAETTDSINRTVPKMAWRQGDFSDLLALDPVKYQIYDPRTARLSGGKVIRDPFVGNKGIPILNPMYNAYAKLYPEPNNVPGLVSAEGRNNYLADKMPKNERFNSILNRFDYNFSERHKVFGRWFWNHRLADEYDWTYETMRGLMQNGLTRINKGIGADYVWTVSGTTVLNLSASFFRFSEGAERSVPNTFKPSDVGLPAYLDERAADFHLLPRLNFERIEDISQSYAVIDTRGTTGEAKAQLTKVTGRHSLKLGWDERRYWRTVAGPGYSSGQFSFDRTYMRKDDSDTKADHGGLEWAAFMMGVPTSVSIDRNDSAFASTPWHGAFIQDDLRITSKLRLNLGFRWEWEQGPTERFNRAIGGGWNFDQRYPFSDIAEAAYLKNPFPEVAAIKVQGAGYYLGVNSPRTVWNDAHSYLPRFGVVYQISPRTVIRAGYGWYADSLNVNVHSDLLPPMFGFSQPTSTTISTTRGETFCCGVGAAANLSASKNVFTDPFPVRAGGTRFDEPYQTSLNPIIFAGSDLRPVWPRDMQPTRQQRWRIGIQRQFSNDMMIDVSYNGARARLANIRDRRVDALPQQYWATGNTRNQAVEDDMNKTIPNPLNYKNFTALATSDPRAYNYLATVGRFNSSTIRKHEILRGYPVVSRIRSMLRPGETFDDVQGDMNYHDLQAQFQKRFSRGFSTTVLYTYATSDVQNWWADEFDSTPSWQINNDVRPHRFVWLAIYHLPFGKGQRYVTSGPFQHIIGGWQFSWIYQRQSGPALGFDGNRFFNGDINDLENLLRHDEVHSADIHQWFDPNIPIEKDSAKQPGSYHVRMLPNNFSSFRGDGIRNWDVKVNRDFKVNEGFKVRFAVDLLNATNHTNFSDPSSDARNPTNKDFGKVTSQRGLSRIIQFNLRMEF